MPAVDSSLSIKQWIPQEHHKFQRIHREGYAHRLGQLVGSPGYFVSPSLRICNCSPKYAAKKI